MTPMLNTGGLQPGFLHAYSAADFSDGMFHELWSDTPLGDASDMGYNFAKFTQPLISNGQGLPTDVFRKSDRLRPASKPAAPGEVTRTGGARAKKALVSKKRVHVPHARPRRDRTSNNDSRPRARLRALAGSSSARRFDDLRTPRMPARLPRDLCAGLQGHASSGSLLAKKASDGDANFE
jgi:hypothetical protein